MKKKTMLILGSIVFVLLLANLSIALESEPTETITYTASTETHCSCGICWIALYSDARNQKDENNIFKPYAEVTKLIYDNGKLKIKWNDTEAFDKEIDLETVIFTGDEQFEPKDFPDNMNYSIDIENKKFNYKYDLSFNLPANDLVIALDMNTDFDYEVFNDYVNVGPHKFGFSDAINENYTISIGTYINKADKEVIRINISRDWVADGFSVGDDVVIDPTIQLKEPNTEVLDDSWISLANPSTNYGSDSDMWINQSTKYAFLGFNITSILGYHEVIDASLNIYGLSSSSGTSYISEYDNQTWTEESITWNNYCSGCVGSILDSASTVTSEFKEYNVTTWVSDEFGNLNNKVSFFYNTTYISATSGYRTATKEYDVDTSRRPYLNITYISNIAPTIGLEVEPTDPSTYVNGAYYQFNITACDVDGYADLSEVIFEWNSANTTITDSVNINASCSEYYVVKSGLDAGNHNWKWYANDSESEWANVISDTWTLNKANPSFSSSVTTPITYGAASDYSASESNAGDTGCTYTLYRNGSSIDTGSSVGDTTVLGVSSYNYTYSTAGCTNYNVGSDYKALVVNKATPSFTTSVTTPINYGTASDYSGSESNAGDNDCTYTLYRNGSSIDTGSSVSDTSVLSGRSYNYTYAVASCTNYSAASEYKALTILQLVTVDFTNESTLTDNTPSIEFNVTDGSTAITNCSLYIDGVYITNNASVANATDTTIESTTIFNDANYTFYLSCKDETTGTTVNSSEYLLVLDAITQTRATSFDLFQTETSAWGYSSALVTDNTTDLNATITITSTQASDNPSTDDISLNITNLYLGTSIYELNRVLNETSDNITYTHAAGVLDYTTENITTSADHRAKTIITNGLNYTNYVDGAGYSHYVRLNASSSLSGWGYVRVALPASQQFDRNDYHLRYWHCSGTVSIVGGVPACSAYSAAVDVTTANELSNSAGTRAVNMKAYDTDTDQVMEELIFNASFSTDFMVLVYVIAGGYVESGIDGGDDAVAPGGGGGETPEGIVAEITEDIFANVTLDCPEGYVWDEFGDYGEPNQCNLYISPLAQLEEQILGVSPILIILVIIVLWFVVDSKSRDKALKYTNGVIPR